MLTEGEAFDDVLIFGCMLWGARTRFYKPRPCTETARRHSLPCCRTRQSACLDGFPTSDVEIRQILTEGGAVDDVLIFGCMFWGAHARFY